MRSFHRLHSFALCALTLLSGLAHSQPTILDFPVQVVMLTQSPEAARDITEQKINQLIKQLNSNFRTQGGDALVRFGPMKFVSNSAIVSSKCELKSLGDRAEPYRGDFVANAINTCQDPVLKSAQHINVYVIDSYSSSQAFAHQDGHGRRNSNRPYVLLDWERMLSGSQSPLEHEMGHAFGLEHVCAPGATVKTPTNIMASADCKKGSGGLRNIGFDSEQAGTVRQYAQLIHQKLQVKNQSK